MCRDWSDDVTNVGTSMGVVNAKQKHTRQHDPKCRLKSSQVKSIYFNHPSKGNSANYYIILGPRDKAAPLTNQQIKQFPPKRVKYLPTPSFIFIFISSSSTGELSALSQSETSFVEQGEYSQNMLSEAVRIQFDEYSELYSRSKSSPN